MKSLKDLKCRIEALERGREGIQRDIDLKKSSIEEVLQEIYDLKLREIHYLEIYRLAKKHFPRLRNFRTGHDLTQEDVAEIEKWADRAKNPDGLKAIVDALNELDKYIAKDVKSNLYALVQRIIIGGAYHQKK